ncbi:putative RDD family membrane protein YckC [Cytobacillus eiseniae]|uniref:RDD family membrane protein YckC n=1 Tax=Cytobacillus eiseniae TaxID=762947 RepID=A0ABS4RAB6_9BACI|nr:RDD family protein [Cytobacillus eiseniae]MBP2239826.1 putative RDD family membrane protein YckC [Cytobacillus eiseniae]
MNQENVGIKTPEFVSLQFQLAGLGSRTAAFIIDQLILTVINILIVIALLFYMNGMSFFYMLEMNSLPIAIAIILIFLINWGYFFIFEFFSGGKTIGKKIIGIRVIQENGHSITLLSSFIRNLLRIIDSLPANYFLGLIMIFFHSKHKRIGDLVAGTIVVHEQKTKQAKKQTAIKKEIAQRGLTKEGSNFEEWGINSLGSKEWHLLKTYSNRFVHLPLEERGEVTREIAAILLLKIGIIIEGKSIRELENILLTLYLVMKDEWEFDL